MDTVNTVILIVVVSAQAGVLQWFNDIRTAKILAAIAAGCPS